MNEDQFSAMLAIIVPPIIEVNYKNSNVDDEKRFPAFIGQTLSRNFRMKNQRNCGITAR